MNDSAFTASVRAELAREILLARCDEEIRRARIVLVNAPKTLAMTERVQAHRELSLWEAKKIIIEQGIYL